MYATYFFFSSLKNGMVFWIKQTCCCGRSRVVRPHVPLSFQNNKKKPSKSINASVHRLIHSVDTSLLSACYMSGTGVAVEPHQSQKGEITMKILCLIFQRRFPANVPALHKRKECSTLHTSTLTHFITPEAWTRLWTHLGSNMCSTMTFT